MKRVLVFNILMIMLLIAGIVWGKDIYVDDDLLDCPDADFTTIQEAIDAALPGDRVLVCQGTYEENISLKTGIEYIGAGAEITASSGNIVSASSSGPKTVFRGFTIDGQEGSSGNGIFCAGSLNISNVSINNTGQNGIHCTSYNGTISDVNISVAGGNGIVCYNYSSPTISNCEIRYSNANGIECTTYNSSPIIRGCIITQNWGDGINITNKGGNPDIGTEADPGLNEIFDNGFYEIDSDSSDTIKAELNWWGECPPNPASFRGNVDYDPWLCRPTPQIENIIPNSGIVCGGTEITIKGQNFENDATVRIGDEYATDVIIVDSETITAKTPSSETVGLKDVVVTNPSGMVDTFKNGFEYYIPLGDVSGDCNITAYDAALILQYLVGLIDQFPATSPIGQAAQKYIAGDITIAELDRMLQSFGYPSVFKLLGYENKLLQNFPNPFNPETWIPFKLAQDTPVTVSIYDTKGQLIRTISLGNRTAGIYTTKDKAGYWDGRNSFGQKVSSGVYFYTLQAGEYQATRKMVIVK